MSEAFRGAGAAIERIAALQAENDELRARLQELEKRAKKDERHIQIRRLEKERDTLRLQIAGWRARQAEEEERLREATKDEVDALKAKLAALEEELAAVGKELAATKRPRDFSGELARVTAERDAARAELVEARAHLRGENEAAYIRRLTEERDELLVEVRELRERVR